MTNEIERIVSPDVDEFYENYLSLNFTRIAARSIACCTARNHFGYIRLLVACYSEQANQYCHRDILGV